MKTVPVTTEELRRRVGPHGDLVDGMREGEEWTLDEDSKRTFLADFAEEQDRQLGRQDQ